MAPRLPLFLFALLPIILLLSPSAISADSSSQLLQGLNSYRASLNLSSLTENDNAACLANQLADQFKDDTCSNTTGSDTVPGTEVQLPNYPNLLDHCHLNISDTKDGQVMPACVPDLVSDLVLSNFTKSQYTLYLNDSQYVGAGIASKGNWVVVVLTTNTAGGSFQNAVSDGSAGVSFLQISLRYPLSLLLLAVAVLLIT
ncbi:putative GPI-anchored protein [Acorus calamus]|uniref:GPI-anchored protein n=1 Tax=Acorus calamus TaxID=4465 RepID=A0AAV9EVB5_ACOCL|nr:putative GPI-anchored protein [Acorus calamus]